jgi:hypothetical protein
MAVELERAPVLTLTKPERRWRRLWRRTPNAGSA